MNTSSSSSSAAASSATAVTAPAVWFSRHLPTQDQISEAAARGFHFVSIAEGMTLGALSLEADDDVRTCIEEIFALAGRHNARAVFGVFATPLLAEIAATAAAAVLRGDWNPRWLACWASWNVARTPEGGRPTFSHKAWRWIGQVGMR